MNPNLTEKEREAACLLALGKCNKEVAHKMGISHKTVEKHRQAIYKKIKTHSLPLLAHYCLHHHWIENAYGHLHTTAGS